MSAFLNHIWSHEKEFSLIAEVSAYDSWSDLEDVISMIGG
jgi:hypothetical protein